MILTAFTVRCFGIILLTISQMNVNCIVMI